MADIQIFRIQDRTYFRAVSRKGIDILMTHFNPDINVRISVQNDLAMEVMNNLKKIGAEVEEK